MARRKCKKGKTRSRRSHRCRKYKHPDFYQACPAGMVHGKSGKCRMRKKSGRKSRRSRRRS